MSAEKWITCKNCGHTYSNKLKRCPECGKGSPIGLNQILTAGLAVVLIGVTVTGFVLGLGDKGKDIPAANSSDLISSSNESSKPDKVSSASNIASQNSSAESKTSSVTSVNDKTESDIGSTPAKAEPPKTENASVSTEASSDSVAVTLSADWIKLFEEITGTEFSTELDETDKAYGISSIKRENDGGATAIFSKDGYKRYKAELYIQIKDVVLELRTVAPFVKHISCGEEFDKIEIAALGYNPETDKETLDSVAAASYACAFVYKSFIGDSNPKTAVAVSTFDTHEVINIYYFPS